MDSLLYGEYPYYKISVHNKLPPDIVYTTTMTTRYQFIHFDSSTASYINDPLNTSGNELTPYNAKFSMSQGFSKIRRVHLKSLELPVGFTNIRKGCTDSFQFVLNNQTYSIVLNENYHKTIDSLLTDLNTALQGKVPSVNIVASLDINKISLTFSGTTTVTQFRVIDTNFSKFVLGFRGDRDTLTGLYYKAKYSNYNLFYDNYILMSIPSLNAVNASMTGKNCTFKIPLNTITNQVYYYFDHMAFSQWVDITDQRLRITDITVVLYDKFGKNINPNGLDYSFTLAIEYFV